MIQIRCKDLQVGYEGKAVSPKLNFCVREGEYFCVVGENGAGKSTLMKTLLQLQKSVGGEIHFENGFDLLQIGYLPQQTMIQKDFPASVRKSFSLDAIKKIVGIHFTQPSKRKRHWMR